MDNKFNNMLQEFIDNADCKDEKELNEKLQEFIQKYNAGDIEYENTPLDDAYELLEKAENAKTEKEALKLAKKAYKDCPECFEALLFQVDLEESVLKRYELLDKGLAAEKERLTKEGYFDKENIGHFYGIFETRPYIRGLHLKAQDLASDGKLTRSKEVCKEILKLNKNDNLGTRYILMAIYAMLEDEKELLKLYKKYGEDSLETLFPLFALYYKLGNEEKALEYLRKVHKANPNLIKLYNGKLEKEASKYNGEYYQMGDVSEVLMYVSDYSFLIFSIATASEFILKNIKK